MYNKKGAMFGLDARIALAIFGALSVISGVTLYNAIQEAKVVSTISQIKEIAKSIEEYYLSVGENLPISSGFSFGYKINHLVENADSVVGWQGPYIDARVSSEDVLVIKDLAVNLRKCDYNFGGSTSTNECPPCTDDANCYVWVKIFNSSGGLGYGIDLATINKIDERLDGGDGYASGDFRVQRANTNWNRAFYKVKRI